MEQIVTPDTTLVVSFIIYTVFIVGVGLYSARRRKATLDDFVLANRELGPWVAALSASASAESGWVMLGLVGTAFTDGISALWIMVGIGIGYLFNWFYVAERLRESTAASGASTMSQFITHRFGRDSKALRIIPVIIITIAMLAYVGAQMVAAGKSFEAVFALPYWVGVIAGLGIITIYTLFGGFRAVAWTDAIQATFMVIALVGMPIILWINVGGFGALADKLGADAGSFLSLTGSHVGYAALGMIIGHMGIGLGYPGQPHVLARFKATRDKKAIRAGAWVAFGWFFLVYIGAIILGMFARAYYGALADPEQALPIAVADFLPPILGGFIIAAIVAAISSTADSQLIVVSTTLSRDVFGRGNSNTEADLKRYTALDRITLVVLAVIGMFFALERKLVFDFVLYAWGVLGAAFGPVVILGLAWKKANRAGAIAGMVTGSVVAVVWKEVDALSAIVYELVPAFILAFLAVLIVSSVTQQDNQEPVT